MFTTATWLVFVAFYIVCLPLSYLFTFPLDWGMVGLWWGQVCGGVSEVILYFILLNYVCNWAAYAERISHSMKTRSRQHSLSFKKDEQIYEPMVHHTKRESIEY